MVKSHIPILTILTALTIIGVITASIQLVSAPRGCSGCTVFKKLTHEFEKTVIEAASSGNPNIITNLLEQYNQDVLRLFETGGR
jgi:hypothetical protein